MTAMSDPENHTSRPTPSPVIFNNYVDGHRQRVLAKNNRVLYFVVNMHRLLGQTYGGWQTSKSYSRVRRILLQSYEMTSIIVLFAIYFLLEDSIISRLFETNTRKVITAGIIRVAGSLSFLQMIIIRAIYFFNGNQLMDSIKVLLKSFNQPLDVRSIVLFSFYFGVCTGISSVMVYISRDVELREVSSSLSVCVYQHAKFSGSI